MIPFPNGLFSKGGAAPGLLDLLSGTTKIVGAWSSTRYLKSSTEPNGAMKVRSNEAGTQTLIGFSGAVLNVAALLAVCVGGEKEGVVQLLDQSGNGNHLAPPSGAADGVIASTTGTLTSPVTVAGGYSVPLLGMGAGNNSGATGVAPSLVTAAPMAVSFGATAKHFMLAVIKSTSGSGATSGNLGNFLHTGDSTTYQSTTSAIHAQLDGSTTSGVYEAYADNGALGLGTVAPGSLHMLGSLYDGAHQTMYADRSAGTPVAYTNALGAGGSYGFGAAAYSDVAGNWCGFFAEVIVGTFTNSAAAFAAGDWTTLQDNVRAFYGTP